MFTLHCDCKKDVQVATTQFNHPFACPECGREIVCVSAEELDDLAAAGDFDAALTVVEGPVREGQVIALGGGVKINIGSAAGNQIALPGEGVAPIHAKLVRVDIGPSRWHLENVGGAPLIVNGQEATSVELEHGDIIQLGEYELRYRHAPAAEGTIADDTDDHTADHAGDHAGGVHAAPRDRAGLVARAAGTVSALPRVETNGPLCPSCERRLGHRAQICVACGIRVPSGRPLLTAQALDENTVYGTAEMAVRMVSWVVPAAVLPLPLASEAYGKFKPYATWIIAAITILMSFWFLSAYWSDNPAFAKSLMLWPLHPDFKKILEREARELRRENKSGDTIQNLEHDLNYSDKKQREGLDKENRSHPFQAWQLLTHALIHYPNFWFAFHLVGNILFLIVFGARVNAIIGNLATAIVYPLFALASGLIFLLTAPDDRAAPFVGAYGAIDGLAGLYFVLLPAHYVYCGIWGRFFRSFAMKVIALRGFWIVLIYFAFEAFMVAVNRQEPSTHWAHLGGFVSGLVVGIAILMSRRFDCRNGDLLSLLLGRHAWPLIGKPSRWTAKAVVP